MSSKEKFCLKWNDFASNISLAFREIRDEKDFFDCTISCGARQIQAHKLILAACSPFFRNILKQNPHPHPLLYLKGVEFNDLQAVLNFMYHGEVNVAQDELNSFLSVAEDLKVKGLTQRSENSTSVNPKEEAIQPEPLPRQRSTSQQVKPPKRQRYQAPPLPHAQSPYQEGDILEIIQLVKEEPAKPSQMVVSAPTSPPMTTSIQPSTQPDKETMVMETTVAQVEESEEDYGVGYEEVYVAVDDQHKVYEDVVEDTEVDQNTGFVPEEFIEKSEDGRSKCTICEKISTRKCDTKRHILSKHSEIQQQASCSYCGKTFKSKQSLGNHTRLYHNMYCVPFHQ